MNKSEDKAPELLKISASSVKTYEGCPRKYYYQYIQKAPKKHWDHLDLGTMCHRVLELFHLEYLADGTEKRSLGKIMTAAFSKARKDFPNMSKDLVESAQQMIADYLALMKENGMPLVKGCETPFTFNLSDSILVRGVIDRLDILPDGRLRIIDYKTTKNEKYLDDFQLSLYGLWLHEQYPDVTSFNGAYVLLKHKSKFKEYTFNIAAVEKTRKKLLDYARQISTENTWVTIPTGLCNYCDFKGICDAHTAW